MEDDGCPGTTSELCGNRESGREVIDGLLPGFWHLASHRIFMAVPLSAGGSGRDCRTQPAAGEESGSNRGGGGRSCAGAAAEVSRLESARNRFLGETWGPYIWGKEKHTPGISGSQGVLSGTLVPWEALRHPKSNPAGPGSHLGFTARLKPCPPVSWLREQKLAELAPSGRAGAPVPTLAL
jgi:hypothetical protein